MPRGTNPKSLANLQDGSTRTPEENRALQKKAVEARKKNDQQRQTFKQLLEIANAMKVENPKLRQTLSKAGFSEADMTDLAVAAMSLNKKAAAGDLSAIQIMLKTRGEWIDKSESTILAPTPLIDLTNRPKNGQEENK
jgi:hypothetical protein